MHISNLFFMGIAAIKKFVTFDNMDSYSTDALAQAAYVSNGLNDIHSSDILTGGTASASNVGNGAAANGCDNDTGTRWAVDNWPTATWWKYDLGAGITKIVKKLRIYTATSTWDPNGFTLASSNNDSDWTDIYSGNCASSTGWQDFTFTNTTAYRYYRITITSNRGAATEANLFEVEMMETSHSLQCYSEAIIKTQGLYSLKGIAAITDSNGKTLTHTTSTTDLSGVGKIVYDIRVNVTGSNIALSFCDTGGTITLHIPNILAVDTYQRETVNLTSVADVDKDAIYKFTVTITQATTAITFYLDNIRYK